MGEIVWLGRYPVKSLRGESLVAADLDAAGIVGDRRAALQDTETGLIASAKNPRRWRSLLAMAAGGDGADLTVTLPGGRTVRGDDPDVDAVLSAAAGRPVRLVRERPAGARLERLTPHGEPNAGAMTLGGLTAGDSFADFGALHIITTDTLDALAAAHPRGRVDARRFRPNVVLRMRDGAAFAENGWPGRTIVAGGGALVRCVLPTPRCSVPTLAQGDDLDDDPEVLRTAARLNRTPVLDLGRLTCVGVYAAVDRPGRLRVGDAVRLS